MQAIRSADPAGDTFTLQNNHDMEVTVSRFGASLVSWWCKDRYGNRADVLLGYRDAGDYRHNRDYFGSTIGRWANRIANGRFTLDGVNYQLDCNEAGNHLHGGADGLHQVRWDVLQQPSMLTLTHLSKALTGGFPGNLQLEISYQLDDNGTLTIDYRASSDAPTPINLTGHPYFNLNGGQSDIGRHALTIHADRVLAISDRLIPVATLPVTDSVFDFRQSAPIGKRLATADPQLVLAHGFDHCFMLSPGNEATQLQRAAKVFDPDSGRQLFIETTAPGLQFYSGNFLAGVSGRKSHGQEPYANHDGFCLEPQAFPDQVNSTDAEFVILRPGQRYRRTSTYRITVNST